MAEALVHRESPVEYFRELVETALHRQQLSAREGTSFTRTAPSHDKGDGFAEVFDELAAKCPAFVDVVGDVSERTPSRQTQTC